MSKILEQAKIVKNHAWLERFRKGNVSMSDEAGKQIAYYVDQFLNLIIADHPADDDEPITAEWLESVGFVYHDLGSDSPYEWYQHPSRLILWDFNEEYWICNQLDQGSVRMDFKTRGQVRLLCRALGIELKEPTK